MKAVSLTSFALIAFAANSILCRLALGGNLIDASSFTSIRLLSGIIVLFVILHLTTKETLKNSSKGSWQGSLLLFIYAIAFSFAYISLDAGTGAVILFATVQITIIVINVLSGNKLNKFEWLGLIIAFVGFVYLMIPSLVSPTFMGFLLMSLAGMGWGLYTLEGKKSQNALSDTAYNFLKTMPFIVVLILTNLDGAHLTQDGVIYAVLSGGLASALGYTVWYMALENLSSTQSAAVQLLVPIIAVLGGYLFIDEMLTTRFVISTGMILGGILLVTLGKNTTNIGSDATS